MWYSIGVMTIVHANRTENLHVMLPIKPGQHRRRVRHVGLKRDSLHLRLPIPRGRTTGAAKSPHDAPGNAVYRGIQAIRKAGLTECLGPILYLFVVNHIAIIIEDQPPLSMRHLSASTHCLQIFCAIQNQCPHVIRMRERACWTCQARTHAQWMSVKSVSWPA